VDGINNINQIAMGFLLFTMSFVGGGLIMCIFGYRNLPTAKRSARWPHAFGVITKSEFVEETDDEGRTTYRAEIEYSYRVDDDTFTGDIIAIRLPISFDPKSSARYYVQHYHAGKGVKVFYDPMKPSKSVLEPGVSGRFYFDIIQGIILILFGLFSAYLTYRGHMTLNNP
jgi:hypothetical protein